MAKIKVSNSMLTNVRNCSTLAMASTAGYGLAQGGDDRKLEAGHAAHVALEHWLQGQETRACIDAFKATYEPYSNRYVESDNAYHCDNLSRILEYFFSAHPMGDMPWEVVATEREIEATLWEGSGYPGVQEDIPVILVDRADGLVRNKTNDSLWAIEHKTTGAYLTADWMQQWRMNPQIMAHLFCWRAEGYDVKGVIMNAIHFGKVPTPKFKRLKSGEMKEQPCRTHQCPVSMCWQAHLQTQIFEVVPSQEVYDAWLIEQRANAAQYRKLLLGGGSIPQEGLVNGHCAHCWLQEFCYRGRNAYELLKMRDAPAWVTRSGLYE
jgi:hypothetical protein